MQLVTGYTGTPHVSAQDDSIRNVMLGEFGGRGVFPVLNQFEATAITANEVRVYSGYGINQGRLFKIDRNAYDSLTIENGTAGMKRADLIVARYTRDEQTGIEGCTLVVIKGTAGSEYVDPSYTTGNILDGALQDDMLMYRVKINGVAIEGIDELFTTYRSLIGGIEPVVDAQVDANFDSKLASYQARFNQMINDDDAEFDTWFNGIIATFDTSTVNKFNGALSSHNDALNAFTGNTDDANGYVKTLGTLPASHGGTGQTSLQATRNAMGLGNTTGALPVANGGTGKSSISSGKVLVGNGTGVPTEKTVVTTLSTSNDDIPTAKAVSDAMSGAGYGDMLKSVYDPNNDGIINIAQGGTGADTVAGARNNLGVIAKAGDTMIGALGLNTSGTITDNNTQAITGGVVYDALKMYEVELYNSSGNYLIIRKQLNIVSIICNNVSTWDYTIPVGYRPSEMLGIPAELYDNDTSKYLVGQVFINKTNGKISMYTGYGTSTMSPLNNGTASFAVTYMVN